MASPSLFDGAGSLRLLYERVDWESTPLGPVSSWPPSLSSALTLALATRFPVTLLWGPEFILLYNEAYVPLIEDKHPAALGTPARTVFPEVWETIGPMLTGVLAGAGPTWLEDSRLLLARRGFLEECYFTFSYSPVAGEDAAVAGVLDIAVETTRRVVDRRRLELLTLLGDELRDLDSPSHLRERALPLLHTASLDLPVVDLLVPVGTAGGPEGPAEPGGPAGTGLPAAPPARLADRGLVLERTPRGEIAWVRLDSGSAAAVRPVLAVLLSRHLAPDETYLDFLALVAAALSNALTTALAREAEHSAAAVERSMSVALQRSLLTDPVEPDHLEICVRYLPAAHEAEVGGDWYDSFLTCEGATCLVVGDVAGHDQQAAATMGQVRNLLRGIGYTIADPPAAVLSALDRAMGDLAVGALATVVLATLEQAPGDAASGVRRLRWSNAGHPPPLLIDPDGPVRLLRTEPDLLLGLDPGTERADHTQVLRPGATVLLYTDGLVERRGVTIDDGLDWLTATAVQLAGLPLRSLCDALLAQAEGHAGDDIALLAVRAHPESAPRPAEAGPERLPETYS